MTRNTLNVSPEALAKRRFLRRALGGTGAALLGGCDRLNASPSFTKLLSTGEALSLSVRNAVSAGTQTMAQEFTKADLSPTFRGNGNTDPAGAEYKALAATGFADWKLVVDGLVETPTALTLAALRANGGYWENQGYQWYAGSESSAPDAFRAARTARPPLRPDLNTTAFSVGSRSRPQDAPLVKPTEEPFMKRPAIASSTTPRRFARRWNLWDDRRQTRVANP